MIDGKHPIGNYPNSFWSLASLLAAGIACGESSNPSGTGSYACSIYDGWGDVKDISSEKGAGLA